MPHCHGKDIRVSRSPSDVGQSRSISFQDEDRNQPYQRQGSRDSSGSEGRGNRYQKTNNNQEYESRIFRRHANRQVTFEDEQRISPPKGTYGRDYRDGNHPYSGRKINKEAIDREIELLREQEKNNPLVRLTGQTQDDFKSQGRNRYRDQHDRRDQYRDIRQNYQPRDRRDNYRDIREQYRQDDRRDNRDRENHLVRGMNNSHGQSHGEDWNSDNSARGLNNIQGQREDWKADNRARGINNYQGQGRREDWNYDNKGRGMNNFQGQREDWNGDNRGRGMNNFQGQREDWNGDNRGQRYRGRLGSENDVGIL